MDFNHNGGAGSINLSQCVEIASYTIYASTIPSCRRASEEVVDEQDGYDMENVIVAEEELRRVLQAWDVGRGVWV